MMKVFFSAIVECDSCRGTGLYIGMCERDGAAVVCHSCKGEGFKEVKHEYNQFSGRNHNDKVDRVYKTAGVYCISAKRIETKDGEIIDFQHGGCSYEEWQNGADPLPVREIHCPLEHYGQGTSVGEQLKNSGPCAKHTVIGGNISACSKKHRAECWDYFYKIYP